jgi:hypothetical protein
MPAHRVAKAAAVLIAASAVALPVVHDNTNKYEAVRDCFVEVLAGPEHGDHPTFLSEGGGTNCGCRN